MDDFYKELDSDLRDDLTNLKGKYGIFIVKVIDYITKWEDYYVVDRNNGEQILVSSLNEALVVLGEKMELYNKEALKDEKN